MNYGLVGEHLGHSFSREIHEMLGGYEYCLKEVPPEQIDAFFAAGDFLGINVTIPYKQTVIPHLAEISDAAREIGAVNTVVRRDGKLCGYNTDFGGMCALAGFAGISMRNKKVLILGTGGTSRTACAVARHLGASEVVRASRTARENALSYERCCREQTDVQVIINTTPCGMFPDSEGIPIDLSLFPALEGVLDAVYNPLNTNLILQARERGILAEGGLYMLVAQAVLASEIFLGRQYGEQTVERIYHTIRSRKENIVLVGMPGSGKTTIGKALAVQLGRPYLDTDDEIVRLAGKTIPEIFAEQGEAGFRDLESRVIEKLAAPMTGAVIATGGGAVLRGENVARLRRGGRLYFLNRPLEQIVPTDDRPLADSLEAVQRRFEERYEKYKAAAQAEIPVSGIVQEAVNLIRKEFEQ